MKRVLLSILAVLLLVIGVGAAFVLTYRPSSRPASDKPVEPSPERLARGAYLVNNVIPCASCHTLDAGDGAAVNHLSGGQCLDPSDGFPGTICSSNITPDAETGIGSWTDGEIMRAIREGVNKDGEALFPMMPYEEFRALSDNDAAAIVAHLRTVPPVRNPVPPADINFPVSFFIKMAPEPLKGPVPDIDRTNEVAYGNYLSRLAGCRFCHTPVNDRMQMQEDSLFAGGHEIVDAGGRMVRSRNLTPHPTGLGDTTREQFISLFRFSGGADTGSGRPYQRNSPMPWSSYAGITDADLGAIYAYLRTLPPVENHVEIQATGAALGS